MAPTPALEPGISARDPNQLILCEDWLSDGPEMAAAKLRLNQLRSSRYSPNTISAYASDWADFEAWCARFSKTTLPAVPEDVALYLAHLLPKFKVSTLERRLAAIASRHHAAGVPAPVTPMVRAVLLSARRSNRQRVKKMAAISLDELTIISDYLASEDTLRNLRDRAVLLLGFACASRRSELASFDLADIQVTSDRITLSVAHSKTDQEGRGRDLVIPRARERVTLDPVQPLTDWIVERGRWPGPLFVKISRDGETLTRDRMQGWEVWYALKCAAGRAGLEKSKFGAHSLRAGFVTASVDAGADVFDIMTVTGHKSVENLGGYVRRSVHKYPLRTAI